MGQVTGIVKIAVNGTIQRSEIGATIDFGGMERDPQSGYTLYGYTEKYVPATLKFTLFHMSDTDLLALKDIKEGTARFECDSGPIYPITKATVKKTLTLKGGDGKVDVEMFGQAVDTKQ